MTEPAKASPGKKAIDYAEDTLGVHKIHAVANAARDTLDSVLTDLSAKRDERRMVEELIGEAEMNIAAEERGKHPDMSQAQMDKHMKVAVQRDSGVRGLRDRLRGIHSDIDGLECDKDMAEADIKIAVARMTELGGYFQYLAIIKLVNGGPNASAVAGTPTIPGW